MVKIGNLCKIAHHPVTFKNKLKFNSLYLYNFEWEGGICTIRMTVQSMTDAWNFILTDIVT